MRIPWNQPPLQKVMRRRICEWTLWPVPDHNTTVRLLQMCPIRTPPPLPPTPDTVSPYEWDCWDIGYVTRGRPKSVGYSFLCLSKRESMSRHLKIMCTFFVVVSLWKWPVMIGLYCISFERSLKVNGPDIMTPNTTRLWIYSSSSGLTSAKRNIVLLSQWGNHGSQWRAIWLHYPHRTTERVPTLHCTSTALLNSQYPIGFGAGKGDSNSGCFPLSKVESSTAIVYVTDN